MQWLPSRLSKVYKPLRRIAIMPILFRRLPPPRGDGRSLVNNDMIHMKVLCLFIFAACLFGLAAARIDRRMWKDFEPSTEKRSARTFLSFTSSLVAVVSIINMMY